MVEIIQSRLQEAATLFDQQALVLCAKKFAPESGDVRRVIEICLHLVGKNEARLIEDPTFRISMMAVSNCIRDARCGSFGVRLSRCSLYEKLFIWGIAREWTISGNANPGFVAVERRLSVELEQIYHLTMIACPGRNMLEAVCDSLLSSRMILPGPCLPDSACPDDVFHYLGHQDDNVLKHLPPLADNGKI